MVPLESIGLRLHENMCYICSPVIGSGPMSRASMFGSSDELIVDMLVGLAIDSLSGCDCCSAILLTLPTMLLYEPEKRLADETSGSGIFMPTADPTFAQVLANTFVCATMSPRSSVNRARTREMEV